MGKHNPARPPDPGPSDPSQGFYIHSAYMPAAASSGSRRDRCRRGHGQVGRSLLSTIAVGPKQTGIGGTRVQSPPDPASRPHSSFSLRHRRLNPADGRRSSLLEARVDGRAEDAEHQHQQQPRRRPRPPPTNSNARSSRPAPVRRKTAARWPTTSVARPRAPITGQEARSTGSRNVASGSPSAEA